MIQRFLGWGAALGQPKSTEEVKEAYLYWCRRVYHYEDELSEARSLVRTQEDALADARVYKYPIEEKKRELKLAKEAFKRAEEAERQASNSLIDAKYTRDTFVRELRRRGCSAFYSMRGPRLCKVVCPTPARPVGPRPIPLGPNVPTGEGWVPTPSGRLPRSPRFPFLPFQEGRGVPTLDPRLRVSSTPQQSFTPPWLKPTTPAEWEQLIKEGEALIRTGAPTAPRPVPGTFVPEKGGWVPTPGPQGRIPGLPQTPAPGWGGGVPTATIPPGGLPAFPQSPLTGATFQLDGPAFRPGALGAPQLGQNEFFLDLPLVSLLGNGLIATGAAFAIPKTSGAWNTIAWAVAIVAGLRALNDFSKIRG